MTTQILQAKLYKPPARLDVVPRPRLMVVLDWAYHAPLTLISAPAGFGKTTLVINWIQQQSEENLTFAWISLDEGDNDPVRFMTYVVGSAIASSGRGWYVENGRYPSLVYHKWD